MLYHDRDVGGSHSAWQMSGAGGPKDAQAWWQALHADQMVLQV